MEISSSTKFTVLENLFRKKNSIVEGIACVTQSLQAECSSTAGESTPEDATHRWRRNVEQKRFRTKTTAVNFGN